MCDGFATVMDPNPSSPREDGIWGEVEFPTLKRCQKYSCKLMTPPFKRTERRHHSKILSCNPEAGKQLEAT